MSIARAGDAMLLPYEADGFEEDGSPHFTTSRVGFQRPNSPVRGRKTVPAIKNKYYVGKESLLGHQHQHMPAGYNPKQGALSQIPWPKRSLAEAVKHAESVLQDNPKIQEVAIVQIVRLVRRKASPVEVEVVR